MSKVTVDIKEIKIEHVLPSSMRANTPYVLMNKKTGENSVVIRLGNDSFVFFGDVVDVSYTGPDEDSVEWVDKHYVVCIGVKATVTLEVE